MAKEREQKFLVCSPEWRNHIKEAKIIEQWYFNENTKITVGMIGNLIIGAAEITFADERDGAEISFSFVVKPSDAMEMISVLRPKRISETGANIRVWAIDTNETAIRIRITEGKKAELTFKGGCGYERDEFNFPADLDLAYDIVAVLDAGRVRKVRNIIPYTNNLYYEVDEFLDENRGLIVAEMEFGKERPSPFCHALWIGDEITHDMKYTNSAMAVLPFERW